MGRFAFGKKGDGDEDSSRSALFGSRSKSKSQSPAPPSQNPYAQIAVPADPYTRAKMDAGLVQPSMPTPDRSNSGNGAGPGTHRGYGAMGGPPSRNPYASSGAVNDRYGPSTGGYGGQGYSNDNKYTDQGYGSDKYNPSSSSANSYAGVSQTSGTSRVGGYGGLGRTNSNDTTSTDVNRDALFGGAKERYQHRQQNEAALSSDYNVTDSSQQEPSYSAYGDRQLTAEEEEEEDIQATKQDIRFMKQQDVSSTRNALRMAAQAEETGRNTLARLGAQGEMIHNTERNLDIGANHINTAEDKTTEIKKLNRSMFAVHVSNPFTAEARRQERDEKIMDRHRNEREQREATRQAAFQSNSRMNQNFKGLDDSSRPSQQTKTSLADRAKYQFEADSEDDQMEDEIDRNLNDLGSAVGRLNILARATGSEVEAQNAQITKVAEKSDRLDERVHFQTERLRRIH